MTGGAISTAGNLSFASTEKKEMKASYKGEAALTNFSSVDKLSGGDLLKFESLSLSDLNVGYTPLSIDIKGISLTDFYARVAHRLRRKNQSSGDHENGGAEASLTSPPVPQEKAESSPEEKGPSKNIKIGQITLQGGRIDVSDKSVKPEFSMSLSEMGGRVSELSAEENTTADVELRGKLNEYTPLEVTGKINPLREDLL